MTSHVPGVGWVYTGLDLLPRVHRAGSLPEDYDACRARMDAYRERCRVEREREWTAQPWPAPEVPMRVVEPGVAPDAVLRVLKALQAAQWRFVVTYARGTLTPARDGFSGKGAAKVAKHYPAKVVDSWALRAGCAGRRAVAIWHGYNGKLTSEGVLCWGDAPARWVGITEFMRGV